ncbi:MAG: DUF5615 family PIN-like protein [Flammeovirgaceae bacterium]|nr:DUF5615 family PIN-like protein [Flammeovirgaceae bacterium]
MMFIVDTQLPLKLVFYLISKGLDAVHATYFNNSHLFSDEEIVQIANKEGLL